MASSTADGEDDGPEQEIRLVHSEGWWVATDVDTDVTSQGETREAALENLDQAVALHRGEIGRPPTDEELRDLGIDPADNVTGNEEPPDVLDSSE
jgi:predicted RNase H-like HicB family nuclease